MTALKTEMMGLMDCNNFYVSCERLFRPSLWGLPVVVLSNNDGCVISRSQEAKDLGIPMGIPLFKIKEQAERENIRVISSNYALYGDISKRVMEYVKPYVEDQEVYSIDECFLKFAPHQADVEYGKYLKRKVERGIGIPVCIGMAPTKTLAKLANHLAKKNSSYEGVCMVSTEDEREAILKKMPISEVWGIGRQYQRKLTRYGIHTAYDLAALDISWVRREMTIVGANTCLELRGIPSFPFAAPQKIKSISRSRSFAEDLTDFEEIYGMLIHFADKCCSRLRQEGLGARKLMIFLSTNKYHENAPQAYEIAETSLTSPTSELTECGRPIRELMQKIFRRGYGYKKAGVVMSDLVVPELHRTFFRDEGAERRAKLGATIDRIRELYGETAVYMAAENATSWQKAIRRDLVSRRYTTCLDEIMEVQA